MFKRAQSPETCWILLGIPVIIVIGTLLHFAYEWSGNQPIIGLFTPINESVWEHLKLAFYPTLLWWLIGYLLYKDQINVPNWIFSAALSLIIAPIIITTFYYTYTGILGSNYLVLDIFSFILGVVISQLIGLFAYNYFDITKKQLLLPITVIFLMIISFTLFTYNPPLLPLFIES